MTLGWRRVYYASAIIAFLVGAPLLVLYAFGYRLNWHNRQIQQTGAITVTTAPRGATVTLDGTAIAKRTPLRIANLLPGKYDIKITKSGFFSWRHSVSVFSSRSTNIQNLVLFEAQPSVDQIWSGQKLLSSLAPDNNLLAVVDRQDNLTHLLILDVKTGRRQTLILPSDLSPDSISWSNNNKNILLVDQTDGSDVFYIYNLATLKLTNLTSSYALPIQQAWWSDEQADIIFASSPDRLYSIDLYNKQINVIWNGRVSDFLPVNTGGYFIDTLKTQARLIVYDPTVGPPEILTDLIGQSYRLWPGPDNWFGLANNKTNQLTINLYPDAQRLIQTPIDYAGKFITWDRTGQRLLFGDGHELFSYYLKTDNYQLITRQIEPYTTALWYPVGATIVLVDRDRLQTINLLNGDPTERYTLLNKPKLNLLGLNKSGEVAYVEWLEDNQTIIAGVTIR